MKNQNILKFIFLFSITILLLTSCSPKIPNMVATMEIKEPIEGVCNNSQVFALSPIFGKNQVKAKHQLSKEEIETKLNQEVIYLKENPNYEDEGMMNIIVNCKGELVKSEMDNPTKSAELDFQIEAIFGQLKTWSPGTLNGKNVDSSLLFSFTIKAGKLEF